MGSRAAAGNYYALQLSVEQKVAGQNISTEASESGTVVYLTVLSDGKVMDQVAYTMGGRGIARQIDFGNVDNDTDGLPDGWEQAYLYGLDSGPEDDPDRDGETNRNEFLLGLNPLVMDARHPADINPADGRLTIQEVSAYYTAWRNGTNKWEQTLANGTKVARGPVPIPVEYVTRATYIWERNEKYTLNSKSASSAPLCLQPHGNMPCGISISALCLTLGQPCVTAVHEDAAMQHATHALCTNAKGVTSAAVPERALWLG
jgi:hypothetical protein